MEESEKIYRATATDGLRFLKYLGLEITTKEKRVFIGQWGKRYEENLLNTTWKLYSEAIPFILGDKDQGSLAAQVLRDSVFNEKLENKMKLIGFS